MIFLEFFLLISWSCLTCNICKSPVQYLLDLKNWWFKPSFLFKHTCWLNMLHLMNILFIFSDFAYNLFTGTIPREWASLQLNFMYGLCCSSPLLVIPSLFRRSLTLLAEFLLQLCPCKPFIRTNTEGIGKHYKPYIPVCHHFIFSICRLTLFWWLKVLIIEYCDNDII